MDFKFVPELYYDLLARVLPGALLITAGILTFDYVEPKQVKEYSSIIVITVGVLCSHYISILLHEIWLLLCVIPKFRKDEDRKRNIAIGIAKIGNTEENNIYKLNRLMRAAAEIDASESLIAGFGLLCISAVVMNLYLNGAVIGVVTILFLFWRNSLIKASETLLDVDA